MYNNNWWLCYSTITITITITLNLQLFHNFVMLKNIVCNVFPVWDMCLSHKGVSPAIVWLFIQFVSRLVVYFFCHLSLILLMISNIWSNEYSLHSNMMMYYKCLNTDNHNVCSPQALFLMSCNILRSYIYAFSFV